MALNKSIPVGTTGFNATYWNVGHKEDDIRGGSLRVRMNGYATKDVREAEGSNPATSKEITIIGEAYAPDMTRAQIYSAIKNDNYTCGDGLVFAGAQDDI